MFRLFFASALLVPIFSHAASIQGAWLSDCQNQSDAAQGYLSARPVDTFGARGTASLRVHVFERANCQGKSWDLMTIPCTYRIGRPVAGLPHTNELDLLCRLNGKLEQWYEIAEVQPRSLRFGANTGSTPATRPVQLGTIYYRRK